VRQRGAPLLARKDRRKENNGLLNLEAKAPQITLPLPGKRVNKPRSG